MATARREYGQISDIRLQLQLEAARARLVATEARVTRCRDAAKDAELEAIAWEAIAVISDIQRARPTQRSPASL